MIKSWYKINGESFTLTLKKLLLKIFREIKFKERSAIVYEEFMGKKGRGVK